MGSSSDSTGGFTPTPQAPAPQITSTGASGPQAQFAAHGGGLMYVPGMGLQYVPPTGGQGSQNAYPDLSASTPAGQLSRFGFQMPPGAGGQGLTQGPTAFASSSATPNASAMSSASAQQSIMPDGQQSAFQANPSNQTPGGLIMGPNHQLVRVPQPQITPATIASQQQMQQQADAVLAQQNFMNNQNSGSAGSM